MSAQKAWRGYALGVGKYALALALLWFAFNKIDITDVFEHISLIPPQHIIAALALLNVAQYVSSLRMRFFLERSDMILSKAYALMLYYVGMFYNLVLPGGVGGDGYKVLILRKRLQQRGLKVLQVLISERVNGLAALFIILFTCVILIGNEEILHLNIARQVSLLLLLLVVPCYVLGSKLLLREKPATCFNGLPYSLLVQIIFLSSGAFLFMGMNVGLDHMALYLALFLLASLLSAILPISIGGVGIREAVFVQAAGYLPIIPEKGVAFAISYFFLYFLSSLLGLAFLNKVKIGGEHGCTNNP